ncbi:MAG: hypothetical protein AAF639_07290 [Chloroflexota bacterium]
MPLLDTNLFVTDRFFKRDAKYADNRLFLDQLSEIDATFSIFSLIELCGISSFQLSDKELKLWMNDFGDTYPVTILYPDDLNEDMSSPIWFESHTKAVFQIMRRKMTWGDAVIVLTAEQYQVDAIVTWNKKDFIGRTSIPILSPTEYLVNNSLTQLSDKEQTKTK